VSESDPILELRQALRSRLVQGSALYRKGDPASQRRGAAYQLHALLDLSDTILTGSVLPSPVTAPVRHLVMALLGLDRGERDDMLKPPAGQLTGAPKLSAHKTGRRARAAVCMELLIRSGESKKDAKRVAAQGFRVSEGQVDDWREQAMTERPSENLLAHRFKETVDELAVRFPEKPRAAADFLIRRHQSEKARS
jgi:hypothetical protein